MVYYFAKAATDWVASTIEMYFLQSRSPRPRCQRSVIFWGLSPCLQMSVFCCVLTWPWFCVWFPGRLCVQTSYNDQSKWSRAPHFNWVHPLQALHPNAITFGGAGHYSCKYEFGGQNLAHSNDLTSDYNDWSLKANYYYHYYNISFMLSLPCP